ncbi:Peptidoglycan-binding Lysin subgroup, partial [Penicillium bovifimosum]
SPGAQSLRWMLLLAFCCSLLGNAYGTHHQHHGHRHLHHQVRDVKASAFPTVTSSSSLPSTLEEAKGIIKNAQASLAVMNKGRLAYPQWNQYIAQPGSKNVTTPVAPALGTKHLATTHAMVAKIALNESKTENQGSQKFTYTIPSAVAHAAKIVAEASPQSPPGSHGVDIAEIRRKYRPQRNDTNRPAQKYAQSNGLDGYVHAHAPMNSALTSDSGADESQLTKRSSADFWLTTMTQRGSSPYAPEGYKVWRNVKEYGAKGDGVTDDTAAINLAVSDGGRCGAVCGSSTIYPAFVYFPPGTYLVSSPIIQYFNTEFFGNPLDYPTILAASSFVGLGVITSDVYTGDTTEWYINTNNFLRSVRNFNVDVTRTPLDAYVCGIHWQVAQGTSLENMVFYMSQDEATTQQGVYMENGSGGFITNLTFVGGNFGAYFGNQQFTTSELTFINAKNALQVHWDWAWTMQDVIIENCVNGLVIVGGAGGSMSTGQSVGSLVLMDALIINTTNAIVTSLFAENSTSFLLQNSIFRDVTTAVLDSAQGTEILAGGAAFGIESWGFGRVATSSTNSTFYNGQDIPAMERPVSLTYMGYDKPNFFQRRRPAYTNIGNTQIIDVKEWGAAGDGTTNDGPILNSILGRAANLSAIVFIPHGIYIVEDTLHIPVGSRIIGQAWSQIMMKGSKFENQLNPHVGVQVGQTGDVGIIEIQSLLFTVSGPTAGAVLVEWNVHQYTQGSTAMWDSHFRVGGAKGSSLQTSQCDKSDTAVNSACVAASLLLHITSQSSAYLENIWAWTADHDLDTTAQEQINIYSGRGILVESQGPTWLYGTSSEHNVLYQYQVSNAKDLYMGMIQTESPYFQPTPHAPQPFKTGLFSNDPVFADCDSSANCFASWALRIIDSSSVYVMGTGIYSWFSDYSQACLDTENCQQRAVEISQSTDTWIYNLVTKGIVEMISPVNEDPTLAANNVNGFMSSILAWVRGSNTTIGERTFPGFQIYTAERLEGLGLTESCTTALTQKVLCSPFLKTWTSPGIGQYYENTTFTDMLCDAGCGESLGSYVDNVETYCANQTIGSSIPTRNGGTIYHNYNLTCLMDQDTNKYCLDTIMDFTTVESAKDMPTDELCSYCYTTMLEMRQASIYSSYKESDKENLELIQSTCRLTGPTELHDPPYTVTPTPDPVCVSNTTYTTQSGDTCDKLAKQYSVASAAILYANPTIIGNCSDLPASRDICMPLACDTQYTLQDDDNCWQLEHDYGLAPDSIRQFNPWLDSDCLSMQGAREILGSVLCFSPQGDTHITAGDGITTAPGNGVYAQGVVAPPADSTVAPGTTTKCGRWYSATADDLCVQICLKSGISAKLFKAANPSLATDCDNNLVAGDAYCVGPVPRWNETAYWTETVSGT